MKKFGVFLIIIGLIWGLAAFNMDTTVSTDSISIGGMYVPSRQVHNIGKLEERRNHLIGSGFCILIGVILFVSGRKSSESQTEFTGKTRKCPACAEEIKIDANICRFCKLDFNEHNWKMALKEGNHTSCPRCLSSVQLDAQEVSSGNFECPICNKTILFHA